jgi:hypothetical protein
VATAVTEGAEVAGVAAGRIRRAESQRPARSRHREHVGHDEVTRDGLKHLEQACFGRAHGRIAEPPIHLDAPECDRARAHRVLDITAPEPAAAAEALHDPVAEAHVRQLACRRDVHDELPLGRGERLGRRLLVGTERDAAAREDGAEDDGPRFHCFSASALRFASPASKSGPTIRSIMNAR